MPAELGGGLDRSMGLIGRCPAALAGLESQHERHLGRGQGVGEAGIVTVEAVGHHRPEPAAGLLGGLDQLDGELRLGPKLRIALALGQPGCWRVRHRMHRPVAALVSPQAGHRDDAVVDLADRPQILAGHMGGGGAVLAVPGVVDHQHSPLTWGGGRVFLQQLDAALVELLVVPSRFR